MPDTDGERSQVLIKDRQKSVNLSRASPESTSLTVHAIKILTSSHQRLRGNLSPSVECLSFIGREGVDVPLDC